MASPSSQQDSTPRLLHSKMQPQPQKRPRMGGTTSPWSGFHLRMMCSEKLDFESAKTGDGSKPWYLVNPKIAGKWMFIPLKMVLIGIDP